MAEPEKSMTGRWLIVAGVLGLLVAYAGTAGAEGRKVYRWVDEQGIVHFGDRVPPEQIRNDREILNEHGIPIGHEEGARTPEELKQEAEAARRAEEARRAEQQARARDETLLDTYLSLEEIETLRNQRTELLDAQIAMTEDYLENLRVKLKKLQAHASHFRPYSSDPKALPINPNLANELSDTLDSIIRYEKELERAQARKQELTAKFAADIDRFRQLRSEANQQP